MNNKPWAYVTSAWSADRSKAKRSAKRYCRKLYEAGYTPICPLLSLPEVIDVSNADEYKDCLLDVPVTTRKGMILCRYIGGLRKTAQYRILSLMGYSEKECMEQVKKFPF